jgi:hypothetical protein
MFAMAPTCWNFSYHDMFMENFQIRIGAFLTSTTQKRPFFYRPKFKLVLDVYMVLNIPAV